MQHMSAFSRYCAAELGVRDLLGRVSNNRHADGPPRLQPPGDPGATRVVDTGPVVSTLPGDAPRPPSLVSRLRRHATDPVVLVPLLPIAAIFCLFRGLHLIADEPYVLYIGVVFGGGVMRVVYSALWGDGLRMWHIWANVGCSLASTAVISYCTGWGAILSIGYIYGSASAIQTFGSKAARPCLVWTTAGIAVGQGAIALHLAPTFIHEPQVQGIAGLGLVGAVLVIGMLGHSTALREKLEVELRGSERRFSALVTSSSDIVLVVSKEGVLSYASPAFEAVLGYTSGESEGLMGERLVHPDDRETLRAAMAAAGGSGFPVHEEIRLRRIDGEVRWFEAAITNLTDDPTVGGFVGNLRDITRRKDAEDRLSHAALHDSLTGLPNRALIHNRAEQMLERARRHHTPVAALFLDLDNFKDINDTLGHEAGDELLAAVASRMAGVVRGGDTVGRLGGDEFVVLVEGDSLAAGAEVVAERIRDILETPFEISASPVPLQVTASIGIAEGDRAVSGELLRDADIALYRAKAAGKHCAVTFLPSMQKVVDDHRHVEVELHRALANGEFFLLYQPTVDLTSGDFNGVEALLRWRHPERGVVQATDFISVLESTGLIVPVGEWVLREACRQGADWYGQGFRIKVSVNISAVQLERDRIIDDVHNALSASGFEPSMLVLELTESTLMIDVEETLTRLKLLKALGVRLAIDDFGTGYSSLAYLRQFPIDVLKIDQTFVSGMTQTKESAAIVHTLIQLGKVLGLETVAEGVENEDQRKRLEAENVNVGQGFHFARPLTVPAVDELLKTAIARRAAGHGVG
jgi:diguanylate cyclase (GGDEF)-like protein/PAS domain S-box-containing protein